MGKYKIEFKRSALKELQKFPAKDIKKVLRIIDQLSQNPRPPGCQKLSKEEKYRVRYRFYRILYSIEHNILTVFIVRIAHRKKAYL